MAYRNRIERDLDRWIAAGHVGADRRAAMLAMVEEPRRLDAATALAFVGALLLGLAVIALVAANWDGLPRLVRFVLVLALFAAAVGGAAWAAGKQRPALSNGLTTMAALIFAALLPVKNVAVCFAARQMNQVPRLPTRSAAVLSCTGLGVYVYDSDKALQVDFVLNVS